MAEAVALGASVVALLQLADRVVGLCKYYIETVRDAPHDLRIILVEISSLKAIIENIDFLVRVDPNRMPVVNQSLCNPNGTITACRESLAELEKLLQTNCTGRKDQGALCKGPKRRRITSTLTALAWPLKENRANKLISEITRQKATITIALLTESSREIMEVNSKVETVQGILTENQKELIYRWLEYTNPSSIHNRARLLHEKDTGLWMLETEAWQGWVCKATRFIWIRGIPGAGKTLLASHLIENIPQAPEPSVRRASIYYYCYFGHNQDETVSCLGWILSQLCRQARQLPQSIVEIHDTGMIPTIEQLQTGVAEILGFYDDVFIVIDAVDESQAPRSNILRLLRTLATDSRFEKVQLLATSRDYLDIESALATISTPIAMRADQVEVDIRKHVHATLGTDYKFMKWPEPLKREVEDSLAIRAKGMFRWAICQLDILKRLRSSMEIRKAIDDLPETLDETYERLFAIIPPEDRKIVQRTLSLLCSPQICGVPSAPAEILLPMIFEDWNHGSAVSEDILYDSDTVKDICGCLVSIGSDNFIRLAHFTVSEFLFSHRLRENAKETLRFFAMSRDIVYRIFLTTSLASALAYVGLESDSFDPLLNLYNYTVFYGHEALKSFELNEKMDYQLFHLALDFLSPDHRPYKRLSNLLKKTGVHEQRGSYS